MMRRSTVLPLRLMQQFDPSTNISVCYNLSEIVRQATINSRQVTINSLRSSEASGNFLISFQILIIVDLKFVYYR